jgi:hypothetical protein
LIKGWKQDSRFMLKRFETCLRFSYHVAGKIIDGSNGDIAVDQYHRFLVQTHHYYHIFLLFQPTVWSSCRYFLNLIFDWYLTYFLNLLIHPCTLLVSLIGSLCCFFIWLSPCMPCNVYITRISMKSSLQRFVNDVNRKILIWWKPLESTAIGSQFLGHEFYLVRISWTQDVFNRNVWH